MSKFLHERREVKNSEPSQRQGISPFPKKIVSVPPHKLVYVMDWWPLTEYILMEESIDNAQWQSIYSMVLLFSIACATWHIVSLLNLTKWRWSVFNQRVNSSPCCRMTALASWHIDIWNCQLLKVWRNLGHRESTMYSHAMHHINWKVSEVPMLANEVHQSTQQITLHVSSVPQSKGLRLEKSRSR